jgi:hypothetical protein
VATVGLYVREQSYEQGTLLSMYQALNSVVAHVFHIAPPSTSSTEISSEAVDIVNYVV